MKPSLQVVWYETTVQAHTHPAFSRAQYEGKRVGGDKYSIRYPLNTTSRKAEREYLQGKIKHLRSFGITGKLETL